MTLAWTVDFIIEFEDIQIKISKIGINGMGICVGTFFLYLELLFLFAKIFKKISYD